MNKSRKGFTLLELIISLSIMSIFLSMIIGSFGNSELRELKNISNKLITDIEYVQKLSMAKNSFCSITFSQTGFYSIRKKEGLYAKDVVEDTIELPKDYQFSFNNVPYISYTPSGTLSANSLSIYIHSKNHYSLITIRPSTGYATIKEIK